MALTPLPRRDQASSASATLSTDPEIVEPLCAVFRRKLRSEGLKYTPERAQVLDTIIRHEGLFEADQLQAALRNAGFRVSKATVYRTIKLLQDSGIIQRVLSDDEQSYYQLVYGQRPHDLVIRVDTRQVLTVEIPELLAIRDRICAARGLVAVGHKLHVFAKAK